MFLNKKKSAEDGEKNLSTELEESFLEEEKEIYYVMKEAYRKVTENSDGVSHSKKRQKLENHLFEILSDLGKKVDLDNNSK